MRKLTSHSVQGISLKQQPATGFPNLENVLGTNDDDRECLFKNKITNKFDKYLRRQMSAEPIGICKGCYSRNTTVL